MTEQPTEVLTASGAVRWDIPRNVWVVLIVWGVTLLVFVGMFSLWQGMDRADAARRDAAQDRAMCQLIDRIIGDTPPPSGPAGQRAREIRADMIAYRDTLGCEAS